jgi:hypothetical protein
MTIVEHEQAAAGRRQIDRGPCILRIRQAGAALSVVRAEAMAHAPVGEVNGDDATARVDRGISIADAPRTYVGIWCAAEPARIEQAWRQPRDLRARPS